VAWVIDLDGVIWLGSEAIDGSADAVARLREAAQTVVFVTNNAEATVRDQEEKLASLGIPAEDSVITSAVAAASMLGAGTTALACGGPGVVEALEGRGVHVVDEGPADAVVVGFHRSFDYERLRRAHRAVWLGARLIGTNADPTYPDRSGPIPGAGSILAAVATAAGVDPDVAGKPHDPMVALVRNKVGDGPHLVVGDRASTDGLLAAGLGARFALVLSGISSADDAPSEPEPDLVADDLAAVVEQELGAGAQ